MGMALGFAVDKSLCRHKAWIEYIHNSIGMRESFWAFDPGELEGTSSSSDKTTRWTTLIEKDEMECYQLLAMKR